MTTHSHAPLAALLSAALLAPAALAETVTTSSGLIYESLKDAYVITPETMQRAKPKMALMHPLPRVGEISPDVDKDPRAAYFREMEYGLFVRMALLAMVLGKA